MASLDDALGSSERVSRQTPRLRAARRLTAADRVAYNGCLRAPGLLGRKRISLVPGHRLSSTALRQRNPAGHRSGEGLTGSPSAARTFHTPDAGECVNTCTFRSSAPSVVLTQISGRTAQSLRYKSFDTRLRPVPFPDRATSLRPGLPAATRTGLIPASDTHYHPRPPQTTYTSAPPISRSHRTSRSTPSTQEVLRRRIR